MDTRQETLTTEEEKVVSIDDEALLGRGGHLGKLVVSRIDATRSNSMFELSNRSDNMSSKVIAEYLGNIDGIIVKHRGSMILIIRKPDADISDAAAFKLIRRKAKKLTVDKRGILEQRIADAEL